MLKTDYKSDVFEGNRKYQISQDGEGKSEILDVTAYSQEGDIFGPKDINATNRAVNALRNDKKNYHPCIRTIRCAIHSRHKSATS